MMRDELNEEHGESMTDNLFKAVVTFLKEYCSGFQVVGMHVYVSNRYVLL